MTEKVQSKWPVAPGAIEVVFVDPDNVAPDAAGEQSRGYAGPLVVNVAWFVAIDWKLT